MAYNAIADNIYSAYLTTYSPNKAARFETHKRSELRGLYNSMVKLNKEAPLYLIPDAKGSARFAVGIKENARSLRSEIASLSGFLGDGDLFGGKKAFSSDPDLVSVEYVGEENRSGEDIPELTMEIRSLAGSQVNLGKYLPSESSVKLPADTYSFDIGMEGLSYEFQFSIHSDETNRSIQDRLTRLINGSGIGLKASVDATAEGTSALVIESETGGLNEDQDTIFTVTDDHTSKTNGMVNYLGIDYTARAAGNAHFLINGEERTARDNHFTLGRIYEVTLHGITDELSGPVSIGVKQDHESLADNVTRLAESFNAFLDSSESDNESTSRAANQLQREIASISLYYKEGLDAVGLNVEEDGHITVDRDKLLNAAMQDDKDTRFATVKEFAGQIVRKTGQISLNPMRYVDKTVVAYKNPGHSFTSPYTTSAYSGMMFSYYC